MFYQLENRSLEFTSVRFPLNGRPSGLLIAGFEGPFACFLVLGDEVLAHGVRAERQLTTKTQRNSEYFPGC